MSRQHSNFLIFYLLFLDPLFTFNGPRKTKNDKNINDAVTFLYKYIIGVTLLIYTGL